MCSPETLASSREAIAAVEAGLAWLATADPASMPASEQADCLQALGRAESRAAAAQAGLLAAFTAARGFETDGQGGPRSWLRFQTRITSAAAAGAAGWMRRLAAHPAVADALAAANISLSWARLVCEWSDQLAVEHRANADQILLGATAGGADIRDLAVLAEEIRRRTAAPDSDSEDDGFADRSLRLDRHYRGAGKLDADLTPQCAAALRAVLDALGKKAGPEDTRAQRQRDHDALEEACRRLIGAGTLPDRAGQPTQIQLQLTLDQLLGLDSTGGGAEALWASHGAAAGPGYDCDAAIAPIVTGTIDHDLLSQLATLLLHPASQPGADSHSQAGARADDAVPGSAMPGSAPPDRMGAARGERAATAARDLILSRATTLLSGPAGLAAQLRRTVLSGPAASISLPLDVGAATDSIPGHLRRAVILRERGHCGFPGGCDIPAAGCQVHHVIPRSEGGRTALSNLGLFCAFHHLILIHRWGWKLSLHTDGTFTATSPDGTRRLRTHSPPRQAALPVPATD